MGDFSMPTPPHSERLNLLTGKDKMINQLSVKIKILTDVIEGRQSQTVIKRLSYVFKQGSIFDHWSCLTGLDIVHRKAKKFGH